MQCKLYAYDNPQKKRTVLKYKKNLQSMYVMWIKNHNSSHRSVFCEKLKNIFFECTQMHLKLSLVIGNIFEYRYDLKYNYFIKRFRFFWTKFMGKWKFLWNIIVVLKISKFDEISGYQSLVSPDLAGSRGVFYECILSKKKSSIYLTLIMKLLLFALIPIPINPLSYY